MAAKFALPQRRRSHTASIVMNFFKNGAIVYSIMTMILFVSVVLAWSLYDFVSIVNQGKVSEGIVTAAEAIKTTLVDAETAERGYIITGDVRFLDPYNNSRLVIEDELKEFDESMAKGFDTNGHSISILARERINQITTVIKTRQDDGFEAAERIIASYQGKQTMDDIRSIVENVGQVEDNHVKAFFISIQDLSKIIVVSITLLLVSMVTLILYRFQKHEREI